MKINFFNQAFAINNAATDINVNHVNNVDTAQVRARTNDQHNKFAAHAPNTTVMKFVRRTIKRAHFLHPAVTPTTLSNNANEVVNPVETDQPNT